MKFANELEEDLVPEWRAKYINYKQGKKKLKAVSRALRNVNNTPGSSFRGGPRWTPDVSSPLNNGPVFSILSRPRLREQEEDDQAVTRTVPKPSETQPINIMTTRKDGSRPDGGMVRHGSIIASPPLHETKAPSDTGDRPPCLHLPDPAMHGMRARDTFPVDLDPTATRQGRKASKHKHARHSRLFATRRHKSDSTAANGSGAFRRPNFIMRVMSLAENTTPPTRPNDTVEMAAYKDADLRQAEFFEFLDEELIKIDDFYRQKEEQSTERLRVIREQLHIMRDSRRDDLIAARNLAGRTEQVGPNGLVSDDDDDDGLADGKSFIPFRKPWRKAMTQVSEIAHGGRVGKGSKAMEGLATPAGLNRGLDDNRDYTRKRPHTEIPYRTAKRKLKIAMQEYYRGLELLKCYVLLNRKGFRKINKKYDKITLARRGHWYMTEKVNKAWFVQSDIVEDHIRVVEDLYARYFERGNHKIAAGKLRQKAVKAGDFTGSVFRSGLWIAAAAVFGIQGLVSGEQLLFSSDPTLRTNTSFLLQLYAGYFLTALLILFSGLACRVWTLSKINYSFVFEFDTRHHLNWRQLCELPCFAMFLLGFFVWLNFSRFGPEAVYMYYPVMLIGITVILLFLPAPILFFKTRQWFLYSNWRLLLAGVYAVEFRDFFLGDMYCSQTYSMGNIELFFCLYTRGWNSPSMCNSSHSRLLGFFTALPGVWRALQCIRRYWDTRNVFPHLANCGKYTCTILFYVSLSIYRINKTVHMKSLFVFWATINSVYCSVWDLVMDWSLLDPYAKHKFLRSTLGYKHVWFYYVAVVIDPILRFNWIFYAIYARDLQHSAVLSFLVSLSEVFRRGMWVLLRVENEHCTNVGRFRASRDVSLPYGDATEVSSLPSSPEQPTPRDSVDSARSQTRDSTGPMLTEPVPSGSATGADIEAARPSGASGAASPRPHHSPGGATLRRRRTSRSERGPMGGITPTIRAMGTMLHKAHAQDYAKKKSEEQLEQEEAGDGSSDDDEEAEERDSMMQDSEADREMEEEAVMPLARTRTRSSRRGSRVSPQVDKTHGDGASSHVRCSS